MAVSCAPTSLKSADSSLQLVAHLVVTEARHVAGRLHVRAQIEHVHQHLHVALPLLIAAVLAGDEQRPIVLHHEHRRQRVVRAACSRAITFGLFGSSVNSPPRLCRMNP